MDFDFTGIKTNLESICKYLESNGVELSDNDSQQLISIFNKVDSSVHKEGEAGYEDGILDFAEEMEFKSQITSLLPKIADKTSAFFSGIRKKLLNASAQENLMAKNDAITVDNSNVMISQKLDNQTDVVNDKMKYAKSDILNIAIDQAIKRMPELKRINPAAERIRIAKQKYPQIYKKALAKANQVTDMVIKNCSKYEVADLTPVVTNMLGVETGGFVFNDRVMKHSGSEAKGVMQTDLNAIKNLYNDTKTSDAKFVKELKSKYKTPNALYRAIQSNVELGLQVGILVFKAKIRNAGGNVARGVRNYCGNTYKYNYPLKIPNSITV